MALLLGLAAIDLVLTALGRLLGVRRPLLLAGTLGCPGIGGVSTGYSGGGSAPASKKIEYPQLVHAA